MNPTLAHVHLNQSVDYLYQLTSEANFSQLYNEFKPKIQRIASKFPKAWFEDFVQEGFIALNKARLTFSDFNNPKHFTPYALHAIRTGMIDFYRAKFERYPNCIDAPELRFEDDETEDFLQQFKDPTNWEIIPQLHLDFQEYLSNAALQKLNFTGKEIRIFELFFYEDQSLSNIADGVGISISQVSKTISKIKIRLIKVFS